MISLRTSPEIKLKENDEIIFEKEIASNAELLIFTNKCNIYKTKVSELPQSKPSELGSYYANIANCENDEIFITAYCSLDFNENILIAFQNGKVVKMPISIYKTKQNRKKLINAFYSKEPVINILFINDDIDIALFSEQKLLVFNSSKIPLKTSKTSQGIQCIKLSKGTLVSMKKFSDCNIESPTGFGCKNLPSSGGKIPK